MHYVGRIDRQIKIRGVRIEPAEIESALMSIAGISKAAVIAADNGTSGKAVRLLAFVTPDSNNNSNNTDSEHSNLSENTYASLKQLLPSQMLPSKILVVERFPTLSNGKIDTNKLFESVTIPDDTTHQPSTDVPTNKTLQVVQENVAQVLGLTTVNITDNFFSIGGDSIQSMKLCATLRHSLNVELSLREMLSCSTIEDIGLLIESMQTENMQTGSTATDPSTQDDRLHHTNPEPELPTAPPTSISVDEETTQNSVYTNTNDDHRRSSQEIARCNASPCLLYTSPSPRDRG